MAASLPPVPASLGHLKVQKGYPIPYFVAYPKADGVADFRYAEHSRVINCIRYDKCFVCGKKLETSRFLIAGPQGLKNRVHSDMPMHETCARFSLTVCPHLVYQKAERRDGDVEVMHQDSQDLRKPGEYYLVRFHNYGFVQDGQSILINFQPAAVERWYYVAGRLTDDGQGWQRRPEFTVWRHLDLISSSQMVKQLKRQYP